MKRLLTAAVGIPLLLAAVYLLPGPWFLALVILVVEWAVFEYIQLVRAWTPGAPLFTLPLLVPAVSLGLVFATTPGAGAPDAATAALCLLAAGLVLTVGVTTLVLLFRTPVREALPAFGAFAFGLPYFGLGVLATYRLHQLDPWLLVLGFAVVFLGDTAAFYVGSAVGRHKMAPVVSPNKSWEGAVASFVTALLTAAVWGWLHFGTAGWRLLTAAAVTAAAAQLGDLVESMLKRGSGVKDSGDLLPGHGGMLDRADAALFALPVLLAAVLLLGADHFTP